MNYCSHCGQPISVRVPTGDNLPRHICDHCGTVHYDNPRVVVGCLPCWGERVLLCRRAIEPRAGYWTMPAGYLEKGETTAEGAARETLEEANARVAIGELYNMVNLPHINQVYIIFRADLLDLDHAPGEESLETALMGEAEIPWQALAFPTVTFALESYFRDLRHGEFPTRVKDMRSRRG